MAISGNQWQSVATSAYGDRAVLSIGRCTPRPAARGTVGACGEGGAVVSTCMLGCIGARGTVGCLLRETIRRHQPSSGVITRHQPSSAVISRHQPSSEAISVPHTPVAPFPAISGNQRPSEAIRGHQRPSEAISVPHTPVAPFPAVVIQGRDAHAGHGVRELEVSKFGRRR